MMSLRVLLLLGITTLCASPAEARGHCAHNQILRVSMGRCVSIHSALAAGYVWHMRRGGLRRHAEELEGGLTASPPRHASCNPRTMCGDPIEDRVVDTPTPNEPMPDPGFLDPFGRSIMRLAPVKHWGVP